MIGEHIGISSLQHAIGGGLVDEAGNVPTHCQSTKFEDACNVTMVFTSDGLVSRAQPLLAAWRISRRGRMS